MLYEWKPNRKCVYVQMCVGSLMRQNEQEISNKFMCADAVASYNISKAKLQRYITHNNQQNEKLSNRIHRNQFEINFSIICRDG